MPDSNIVSINQLVEIPWGVINVKMDLDNPSKNTIEQVRKSIDAHAKICKLDGKSQLEKQLALSRPGISSLTIEFRLHPERVIDQFRLHDDTLVRLMGRSKIGATLTTTQSDQFRRHARAFTPASPEHNMQAMEAMKTIIAPLFEEGVITRIVYVSTHATVAAAAVS